MLRSLICAAVMLTAIPAFAADGYKVTAGGKCQGPDGKFAKAEMCQAAPAASAGTYTLDKAGKCHGPDGKFAKAELCAKK